MNGRIYDPLVGRMFTPDPIVTDNTRSDAFNKYSYALNNPLRYIDPNGNEPITIGTLILIGALVAEVQTLP